MSSDHLVGRLEAVEGRLRGHARSPAPSGLTPPDPPTGERWEWGQVWAHLAEFVPYWIAQAQDVVAAYRGEPVPFGRTKADAGRIAAIERDRGVAVHELSTRLDRQIADLREFLAGLPEAAWSARGAHSTLGVMPLERIVDEFLVGHLEQHAAQLEQLA
jgi:DinB superfamily